MMQCDATSVVEWRRFGEMPRMKEVRKRVVDALDWTRAGCCCFVVPLIDS